MNYGVLFVAMGTLAAPALARAESIPCPPTTLSVDGGTMAATPCQSTDSFGIAKYVGHYLTSSVDLTVDDFAGGTGITATWSTDSTGGYAHVVVPTGGSAGLLWTNPSPSTSQIYVRFDLRRLSNSYNTKQLKLFGHVNGATSNFTFGPQINGYSGGSGAGGVAYGESGGDNSQEPSYDGVGGTPNYVLTPHPTIAVKTSGVTQALDSWDMWEMFVKKNDDGTPNGEVAVWKNGTLIWWAHTMYNCGTGSVHKTFDYFHLFGYANGVANATEDYRNVAVSYDRPKDRGI